MTWIPVRLRARAAGSAIVLGASCALLLVGCGRGAVPVDETPRLNLLVISLDTLRADHLGCYGYGRDTSPALDAFARRSVRFEHAIAPAPWTLPSHVSLLTGLLPQSHGVHNSDFLPGEDTRFLAELLWPQGWYTFGLTDGGYMAGSFGFERGFRAFYDRDKAFSATVREAQTYITDREPYGPWFAFLHTYDIHCPYDPAEPYRSLFQSEGRLEADIDGKCGNPWLNEMHLTPEQVLFVKDRYDGGIREVDAALEGLLRFLEDSGRFEDTVIVITSDHGEEFLEHGQIGHERSVQRELLEVPLLIYAPGLDPAVIDAPVSLVDVLPTILDLLDQPLPPNLDGRSLLGLIQGTDAPALGQPSTLRWQVALDAWWTPDTHLIVDQTAQRLSLFDLTQDPGATQDRAPTDPERTQSLLRQLKQRLAQTQRRPTQARDTMDAAEAERLRGLGYVDGGGQ